MEGASASFSGFGVLGCRRALSDWPFFRAALLRFEEGGADFSSMASVGGLLRVSNCRKEEAVSTDSVDDMAALPLGLLGRLCV